MTVITMIKLKGGMCRWPFGNPEDKNFQFCGNSTDLALSYCEDHMVMAHAPDKSRKSPFLKAA